MTVRGVAEPQEARRRGIVISATAGIAGCNYLRTLRSLPRSQVPRRARKNITLKNPATARAVTSLT